MESVEVIKMSKRTYLKIFSILLIVFGALAIILAVISLTGGTMLGALALEPVPTAAEDQEVQNMAVAMGAIALVLGVLMLVIGVFNLITGILGVRVSTGHMKSAGAAKVMGIIGLICVAAMNIYLAVSDPTITTIARSLAGIGVQYCFVWGICKVQEESKTLAE